MNKGESNIDIVFRNGLKDYEVLPPPDVWDNIHPVIKRQKGPVILIRAAALVTILISISVLAYRSTRIVTEETGNTYLAFNVKASLPFYSPDIQEDIPGELKMESPGSTSQKVFFDSLSDQKIIPPDETPISPAVGYLMKSNSLPENYSLSEKNKKLLVSNTPENNSNSLESTKYQYIAVNEVVKSTERWSIAAMASPTYYSTINSGTDDLSKQLMASEQSMVSYSGGVALAYKVSRRLSIQSGLYYSSLGQSIDGINSYSGFQPYDNTKGDRNFEVLTTRGTVYTNNADVFLIANNGTGERVVTSYTKDVFDPKKSNLPFVNNSLHQNFSYLELPVVLRYKLIDKTIDFNLIGGVSYNLLIDNSVYTTIDGNKYPVGETEGLSLLTLSSSLGMGMEYNISKKFSLNLEPTFRYFLNPYNEVTGSKIHPYSFGIFSGVSYKF
jgi:hypothetical protein